MMLDCYWIRRCKSMKILFFSLIWANQRHLTLSVRARWWPTGKINFVISTPVGDRLVYISTEILCYQQLTSVSIEFLLPFSSRQGLQSLHQSDYTPFPLNHYANCSQTRECVQLMEQPDWFPPLPSIQTWKVWTQNKVIFKLSASSLCTSATVLKWPQCRCLNLLDSIWKLPLQISLLVVCLSQGGGLWFFLMVKGADLTTVNHKMAFLCVMHMCVVVLRWYSPLRQSITMIDEPSLTCTLRQN
jgi:hypothetical protein